MTPFSANSTCAESARASGASRLQSRLQTRTAERHERTPQDASCSRTASLSFLSPTPEPASGVVVVVLLLLGAYYSPEGLALTFVCCLCLLLAHTYQAIVVLLPKLTNAPTKVQTSGALGTFACYVEYLLLVVFLYCADHYASSSTVTQLHTHS